MKLFNILFKVHLTVSVGALLYQDNLAVLEPEIIDIETKCFSGIFPVFKFLKQVIQDYNEHELIIGFYYNHVFLCSLKVEKMSDVKNLIKNVL